MLKVLELFAGIGACSKALERLGIEHEIVDAVEIDKYAITSFNAIHGTNFDVQDITKWDKDVECDLIMHGSPCFLAGEFINTIDGFKKIEDINIGDLVKSYDGSYNRVTSVMHNINNYIYDIKCSACHNINTTFNHPYYVLRNGKYEWITASELTTSDYLCIPVNKNENEVEWDGTTLCYNMYSKKVNELPLDDLRFWYLIGRFIGDGWVCRRVDRNNNISGIKICCAKSELVDLKNKLGDVLNYCIAEDKTTYKLQFTSKELGEFCAQFGVGAKNKQIPPKILNIKTQYLEYLLQGIVDSDGCFTQGKYKVTTISKSLAYNLGELVLKVKHIPYHIYKVNRPDTCVIENRVVNQNDTYQITWSENYSKKINYVDDDYLYTRIRKINNRVELCDVYNIEVENTHSYCVMNIATHNCQDFSVAGKQAGGDVGSGTRSSLMYETVIIVGKLRPKYVVWENVKNLLSKKHKHNFDAYIETMNILGYNSYYQVLNAKDYGIPQNRERVFTISIRKDIDKCTFKFPEKEPLKLRLKDMLKEQVDEKYYLSDVQVGTLDIKGQDCIKRVYSDEGLSPTLTNMQGGNRQPKILEDPTIQVLGNYMPSNHDASRIVDSDGLAPTVKENHRTVTATVVGEKEYERTPLKFLKRNQKNINGDYAFCVDSCNTGGVKEIEGSNLRIRKLTPKECWRLMGFDDEDFEKARNALNEKFYKGKDKSSSQLYKQAGNSIVVNVLEKIFNNLLEV